MNVLSVKNLHVSITTEKQITEIVRGISFDIGQGDFFCLVGESGCGKSITAMALTRLPPTDEAKCSGEVLFKGRDVLPLRGKHLRSVRGHGGIAYIFQDPMSALNPVLSIATQMREALPRGFSRSEAEKRMLDLLSRVDLPDPDKVLRSYPCELSGGMAQRVCIAMAMASEPSLLIADEPSTALDVVTQQRVLELLDTIRRDTGTSIMLITHNLGLVARYGHKVSVMYAGLIIESGNVGDVLRTPRHPYSSGLLAAVPGLADGDAETLVSIPGRVPAPSEWGAGCTFEPRCHLAMPICREIAPPIETDAQGHSVACHAARRKPPKPD